jgi:hypothetical protein
MPSTMLTVRFILSTKILCRNSVPRPSASTAGALLHLLFHRFRKPFDLIGLLHDID